MKARRKNLFGFKATTTHSPKLMQDAFDAGRRSGDTKQFDAWLQRQRPAELHFGFKRRLKQRYHAGVESLWKEERKAAKKEKVASKQEARAEEKSVQRQVIDRLEGQGMTHSQTASIVRRAYRKGDSASDLYAKVIARNPKLKRNASDAYNAGRAALRAGAAKHGTVNLSPSIQQREDWKHAWADFMRGWNAAKKEKNPARFDRCVKKVKKSAKKSGKPANAYAVCTAAGTRNKKTKRFQNRRRSETHW